MVADDVMALFRPHACRLLVFQGLCAATAVATLQGCATQKTKPPQTVSVQPSRPPRTPPVGAKLAVPGPRPVRVFRDILLRQPPLRPLAADLYRPDGDSANSLVFFIHGNGGRKESFRRHARHLASWGVSSLVVQWPPRDRWVENGKRLARWLKKPTHRRIGLPVEDRKVILVGHSFGASAAVVAAAQMPHAVRAAVLLDPALYSDEVRAALPHVGAPAVILGADRDVYRAKKRDAFFERLGARTLEFSLTGATHNDAQWPTLFALHSYGLDPYSSPRIQRRFRTCLAVAVLSLAKRGEMAPIWRFYLHGLRSGIFKKGRKRLEKEAPYGSPPAPLAGSSRAGTGGKMRPSTLER